MKKYYLFVSVLFFLACKKESHSPSTVSSSPSIVGFWELQVNISNMYTNGNFTQGDTSYSSPNDLWLKFNSGGSYMEYHNTIPEDSGQYINTNNLLSCMSGSDTVVFTTTLGPNSLILYNKDTSYLSFPDTLVYETQLTFKKK